MRIKLNDLSNKLWIDLGCGPVKRERFIGIDMNDHGQDIVWDLRKGIPLPDESVEYIFTSHFLEHLTVPEAQDLFHEIVRISAQHATFTIHLPHADTVEAFYMGHYSLWTERTIEGLIRGMHNMDPIFEIKNFKRNGMELQCTIEIDKTKRRK